MNARSVLYSSSAMVMYAVQHVLAKDIAAEMADAMLVLLYAAAGSLPIASLLLASRRTCSAFIAILRDESNWAPIVFLTCAGLLSSALYFVGIQKIPIAAASSILNTSVFWGAALAWLCHGQSPSRWLLPSLLLVFVGLVIQFQPTVGSADGAEAMELGYLALLVAVPALHVLRPYVSDKRIHSDDPVAVALATSVPHGLVGLLALTLLWVTCPDRVTGSFVKASVSGHLAFIAGACSFLVALVLFQKAMAATDDKAAPALFFGLIPTLTALLGFALGGLSELLGLSFARLVRPTAPQMLGAIVVTGGLLAYALLSRVRGRKMAASD